MALQLQTHMPHVSTTFSPLFSSHPPPQHLSVSRVSFKTQLQNSIFSTSLSNGTNTTPCSLSTLRRKLLCIPDQETYVEDDHAVQKLSAEELDELVRGDLKVPLIIDFYATWCGPCVLMAQQLEMLAVENAGKLMIVKVDTDDEHELARDMQVRGLPTLYFISPNTKKNAVRTEGLVPLKMIREILEDL